MIYRKLGKLGIEVSLLGFGCMRLPTLDNDSANIKEDEAIKIIRYAIDNGVTYIDTAYPYHKGNSEVLVGKALRNGYRDKVYLATKMPVWLTKTYEDFDKYLNEQLEKLQTDHIDFYLLHALDKKRWENLKNLNVLDFMEKAVKDGRIKYIGFSFHDELELFKEIIDYYDWDFCQIQLNYMDTEYQAGLEGLKYAGKKNIPVIIMEPLKGGKLVDPPEKIQKIWDSAPTKRIPVEWAFNWISNFPEVSIILSGMSNLDQVIDNIVITSNAKTNSLTKEELKVINQVRDEYLALTKVNCTDCKYCLPCPVGVNIPRNFSLYNDAYIYDAHRESTFTYNTFLDEKSRASACIECKKCEEVCPQKIQISKRLKEVHNTFGK